jgi:RNA polymerase sigma-70 factor (TIGR02943 family)
MSNAPNQNANIQVGDWFSEFGNELYSWAVYKTSSKETAEDLVQETLLSAFKAFDSFKVGSNPKTWLFTILNNKIIDYYRASSTKKSVNETELLGNRMDDENFNSDGHWNRNPVAAWANEEEHLLDNAEFLEVLNLCIQNLPTAWQNVIVSKYFDHKKGKQISKELNITSSNLWQIAHRAKLQLKDCLDKNWENK